LQGVYSLFDPKNYEESRYLHWGNLALNGWFTSILRNREFIQVALGGLGFRGVLGLSPFGQLLPGRSGGFFRLIIIWALLALLGPQEGIFRTPGSVFYIKISISQVYSGLGSQLLLGTRAKTIFTPRGVDTPRISGAHLKGCSPTHRGVVTEIQHPPVTTLAQSILQQREA